jgi:hypothetical protein
MDSTSLNYNPLATQDNGSCILDTTGNTVYGCMDSTSLNYNPLATQDNGSCVLDTTGNTVYGCMDSTSLNYNPLATQDNGSCVLDTTGNTVYGCMDSTSLNYNPLAIQDNGSCFYSTVIDINALKVEIFGCTDKNALNYKADANKDNGSCTYSAGITNIPGCMDSTSLNYNPKAVHNIGNVVPCIYHQDTVFSKIDLSGRTIKQVVEKVNNSFCAFDYLALVEDASIEDVQIIDANNVQVKWNIFQGGVSYPISQSYQLSGKVSETVFYLTVSCDTGGSNTSNKTARRQKTKRTFRAVKKEQASNVSTTYAHDEIFAYPNPLQDVLNFKGDLLGNVTVEIFNSIGIKVYENIQTLAEEVNVSSFESGVYFVTITSKENIAARFTVIK